MHRWAGLGKNKHVDFHNLSSKSAKSDFPFTLYVLARHYTTGGYAAAIFPLGEYGPLSTLTSVAYRGLTLRFQDWRFGLFGSSCVLLVGGYLRQEVRLFGFALGVFLAENIAQPSAETPI